MTENEYLMRNGDIDASKEISAQVDSRTLADRIVRLEAGFATIMQAYDDPKGNLRYTVADAILTLFPVPNKELADR